jgi:hypothetical protein
MPLGEVHEHSSKEDVDEEIGEPDPEYACCVTNGMRLEEREDLLERCEPAGGSRDSGSSGDSECSRGSSNTVRSRNLFLHYRSPPFEGAGGAGILSRSSSER